MISYSVYKVIHLLGVFLTLGALFGWTMHYFNGGQKQNAAKKLLGIMHGVGLVFVLIAGFGLLARIDQSAMQLWVGLKLLIWLSFGMYTILLHKGILKPKLSWFVILALATSAVILAQLKI
ncbi:MAG: hypothetical protein HOO06_15130 [Bdellovibrionaceae bacterium]|jgi:hypothetical protein|nr:hypothetical protein [Pseudobdellovibrionaceae bacterium]